MVTASRKFQPLWYAVGLVLGVIACDANVVIGTKLRLGTGGGGAAGGVGVGMGGSGSGVSGDALGGSAMPEAGTPTVGTAGEAGAGGTGDDRLIFFAGQDDGTESLMEWDSGSDEDSGGFYADPDQPTPTYSTDQHHSGAGSAKLTIDTSTKRDQIARLYRRIETPTAYYIAWFYLAEDHTSDSWWSTFLFRAVKNRDLSIDLWSIDLVRTPQDTLTVAVFDHANSKTIDVPTQPKVPVRQWFQIQARLEQAAGQPSQLTLWLDGQEFLTLKNTTSAPLDQPLYWVIGNGASKLTPGRSTIYIDDAQISTAFVPP